MKSMTCRELGGGCDETFFAESFDEIAAMSRQHGVEMVEAGDHDHLEAMEKMKELMKDHDAVTQWMEEKKNLFDSL